MAGRGRRTNSCSARRRLTDRAPPPACGRLLKTPGGQRCVALRGGDQSLDAAHARHERVGEVAGLTGSSAIAVSSSSASSQRPSFASASARARRASGRLTRASWTRAAPSSSAARAWSESASAIMPWSCSAVARSSGVSKLAPLRPPPARRPPTPRAVGRASPARRLGRRGSEPRTRSAVGRRVCAPTIDEPSARSNSPAHAATHAALSQQPPARSGRPIRSAASPAAVCGA